MVLQLKQNLFSIFFTCEGGAILGAYAAILSFPQLHFSLHPHVLQLFSKATAKRATKNVQLVLQHC